MNGVDKSPGAFDVTTDKRVFRLQASNAGEMLQWVEGMRAWRAYSDAFNSPAAALNRRSISIPARPSQPPPPVPLSTDSLDAPAASPGAPYVLAGAFPPSRPSISQPQNPPAPEPSPSIIAPPSPSPSPKPSVSPSPSPAPTTSATSVISSASSSATPSTSASASSSYTTSSAIAMKKASDGIQRMTTPTPPVSSLPANSMSRPSSTTFASDPTASPAAPAPLSEILGSPAPKPSESSQNQLPTLASILNEPQPATAPLSDLLGAPPARSNPSTPSSSRPASTVFPASPVTQPSSTAATPSTGCVLITLYDLEGHHE